MIEVFETVDNEVGPWGQQVNGRAVKSAERTLAVFELFSIHQRPMTVGQIARHLDIPQPSATMLLRNLMTLGYLEYQTATRCYLPTLRIMLLGSWIHRRFKLALNIEERLADLVGRLDESVLLGIQNGMFSQYISALSPEQPERLEVQSGMLRPITRTAVGQMLLSQKTDAEVSLIVRRCNAEMESCFRVDPDTFLERIRQTRARAYAETCGDMREGFGVLAVLLPSLVGSIPVVIGIGGASERIARKRTEILGALFDLQQELALAYQSSDQIAA